MGSESDSPPNWLDLPAEVTASIFSRIDDADLLWSVQFVCSLWQRFARDPLRWRTIDIGVLNRHRPNLDLPRRIRMCLSAVDYSSGNLESLILDGKHWATILILDLIAYRPHRIKCLRVGEYNNILNEEFCAGVANLPLLEELEISCTYDTIKAIEAFGQHCPHLKSLKIKFKTYLDPDEDEIAIAIAENLPQLLHLQLIGNSMTSFVLKTILDGCSHLDSLDLSQCRRIRFSGNLWKSCTQQIKNLRLPNDDADPSKVRLDLDDDLQDSYDYVSFRDFYIPDYGF